MHFADDKEKMRDFNFLSKDEFLLSYSYLTEEEYNETCEEVYERNYQTFINGLEKLTKKTGIGISACGCFFYDLKGFKTLKYKKDSSSGDLYPEIAICKDGTNLFK